MYMYSMYFYFYVHVFSSLSKPCDPNSPVMDDSPDYESLIYDDIFSESPGKMKVAESRPHNVSLFSLFFYVSGNDCYGFRCLFVPNK